MCYAIFNVTYMCNLGMKAVRGDRLAGFRNLQAFCTPLTSVFRKRAAPYTPQGRLRRHMQVGCLM